MLRVSRQAGGGDQAGVQAGAAATYARADVDLTEAQRTAAAGGQFQKIAESEAKVAQEARQACEAVHLTLIAELQAMR